MQCKPAGYSQELQRKEADERIITNRTALMWEKWDLLQKGKTEPLMLGLPIASTWEKIIPDKEAARRAASFRGKACSNTLSALTTGQFMNCSSFFIKNQME